MNLQISLILSNTRASTSGTISSARRFIANCRALSRAISVRLDCAEEAWMDPIYNRFIHFVVGTVHRLLNVCARRVPTKV